MKACTFASIAIAGSQLAGLSTARNATAPPECNVVDPSTLGNGYCDNDDVHNTAACGWDGGDCCAGSCVSTEVQDCGSAFQSNITIGFPHCLDPKFGCIVEDPSLLGNGFCNDDANHTSQYNTLACQWDGGDCCADTCVSTDEHECGTGDNGVVHGFPFCNDPHVCSIPDPTKLGDGFCDGDTENSAVCGWDGGDCCEETCLSTANITCGTHGNHTVGFPRCFDPDIPTDDVPVVPPELENCLASPLTHVGDGVCNTGTTAETSFNVAACGWDGGDCCSQTCKGEHCGTDTDGNLIGFECHDPAVIDHSHFPECDVARVSFVGDGYCDHEGDGYNTAACNWDGGDCCQSSCMSTAAYECSAHAENSLYCHDPSAPEFVAPISGGNSSNLPSRPVEASHGPSTTTATTTAAGTPPPPHHGHGGEVPPTTTTTPATGGTPPLPPHHGPHTTTTAQSTTMNDVSAIITAVANDGHAPGSCAQHNESSRARLGNGICDNTGIDAGSMLNTAGCGWDGGDCCPSTCHGLDGQECSNDWYTCLDPQAPEVGTAGQCDVQYTAFIGNGVCNTDGAYNTEACNWDGGDCCISTCDVSSAECGSHPVMCLNPLASENAHVNGTCDASPLSFIGDGFCDSSHNTHACNWDGGDCCVETCVDGPLYPCGYAPTSLENAKFGEPLAGDTDDVDAAAAHSGHMFIGFQHCMNPYFRHNNVEPTEEPDSHVNLSTEANDDGAAESDFDQGSNSNSDDGNNPLDASQQDDDDDDKQQTVLISGVICGLIVVGAVATAIAVVACKKNTQHLAGPKDAAKRENTAHVQAVTHVKSLTRTESNDETLDEDDIEVGIEVACSLD